MARTRRTANASAAPVDEKPPAALHAPADFDAEASLLELQRHVDATAAHAAANLASHSPLADASHAVAASSNVYAASAALYAVRPANGHAPSSPGHHAAQIHPALRDAPALLDQPPPRPPLPSQYPPLSPIMSAAAAPAPVAPAPALPAAAAAVAPQSASPVSAPDGAEVITDGRRGPRRELSTSKRAAQNRAAQRAFRQRKEGYIKKLEKQVQDYGEMESQFKITQSENYALREYIIHLQSRLLDAKAELPQPPASLNLAAPGMPPILGIGPSPPAPTLMQQQNHHQLQQALEQQEQQRQLQHFQSLQQKAAPASSAAQGAAAGAAGAAADPSATAATGASDTKNESSLARVAQAAAQLGSKEDANGPAGKAGAGENGTAEPMDTEEAITQNLQKLSEQAASV